MDLEDTGHELIILKKRAKSGQNGTGTKRYGDSFEHLFRKRSRRSAKPKFLVVSKKKR